MKNIQKIIDLFGGMDNLKADYIRLEQPNYDRLVIEAIGRGPRGLPSISVAHYSEQNGDAMRDPEITFEIDAAGTWRPTTFQNDYVGLFQEVYPYDQAGRQMIRPQLIAELNAFAKIWNRNIKEQGWIEVAEKLAAARIAKN